MKRTLWMLGAMALIACGDDAAGNDNANGNDNTNGNNNNSAFDCQTCVPPMECNAAGDGCVFDCDTCVGLQQCNGDATGCVDIQTCAHGTVDATCVCGGELAASGHCCEGEAGTVPCLPAPALPFQHHFGLCWRGTTDLNLRATKALGYHHIIDNPLPNAFGYKDHPDAKDLRFFIESPENGIMPELPTIDAQKLADLRTQSFSLLFEHYPQIRAVVKTEWLDALKLYDNAVWEQYKAAVEDHFCWSDASAEFPLNMAQAWIFGDGSYRFMYDYQQQRVIDWLTIRIRQDARGRENPANNYLFTGLAWDVENRWAEFHGRTIQFDSSSYPSTSADPNATAVAHAGVTHDYLTFREGCFRFYLSVRAGLEAEFGNTRNIYYVFEPWDLWGGGWNDLYTTYTRAALEAPFLTDAERPLVLGDYLTVEGPGVQHFLPAGEGGDLDDIEASGYLTRKMIGSSTQSVYDYYYDPVEENHLTYLGNLAKVGVWFNSFGALNRTADNLSEWPDELVLSRLLPNWDNIHDVALIDRSWDAVNLVYRSPVSYADRDVIYSRQPGTGLLFVVFLSTQGQVTLGAGEQVVELRRTNEVYEAHGAGSADAAADLDVVGQTLSLNVSQGLINQLYVIVVQ